MVDIIFYPRWHELHETMAIKHLVHFPIHLSSIRIHMSERNVYTDDNFARSNPHILDTGQCCSAHGRDERKKHTRQHKYTFWLCQCSRNRISAYNVGALPVIRNTCTMFAGIFLIYHYITNRTIDNHHIVVLHCCSCHLVCIFFCASRERSNQPNSLNFSTFVPLLHHTLWLCEPFFPLRY